MRGPKFWDERVWARAAVRVANSAPEGSVSACYVLPDFRDFRGVTVLVNAGATTIWVRPVGYRKAPEVLHTLPGRGRGGGLRAAVAWIAARLVPPGAWYSRGEDEGCRLFFERGTDRRWERNSQTLDWTLVGE